MYPAVSSCVRMYLDVCRCVSSYLTASKTGYGQKYTSGEGLRGGRWRGVQQVARPGRILRWMHRARGVDEGGVAFLRSYMCVEVVVVVPLRPLHSGPGVGGILTFYQRIEVSGRVRACTCGGEHELELV